MSPSALLLSIRWTTDSAVMWMRFTNTSIYFRRRSTDSSRPCRRLANNDSPTENIHAGAGLAARGSRRCLVEDRAAYRQIDEAAGGYAGGSRTGGPKHLHHGTKTGAA